MGEHRHAMHEHAAQAHAHHGMARTMTSSHAANQASAAATLEHTTRLVHSTREHC